MTKVDAVRKGPVAAKMILDSKVDNIKEVHRKGEKKNWYQKYNDHTIVFDNGKEMTLKEATKYLNASIYIDKKDCLRYLPQVVIENVEDYLKHTVTIMTFDTNVEAQAYFTDLMTEHNLVRI